MNSPLGRILVRADAGPEIGAGYVTRCFGLAQALAKLGRRIDFVCGPMPAVINRKIRDAGFGLHTITQPQNQIVETKNLNEMIQVDEPSWLVLAGTRFDDSYEKRLELHNSRLFRIDDFFCPNRTKTGMLLDLSSSFQQHNPQFEQPDHESMINADFVLVRSPLQEHAIHGRRNPGNVKRILVAVDGSDATNLNVRVLNALSQCRFPGLSIDVFLDPSNRNLEDMRVAIVDNPHSIRVHGNFDRVYSLFSQMDMAITDGNSIGFELAHNGIPTVVFPATRNQHALSNCLEKAGAVVLGNSEMGGTAMSRLIYSTAKNMLLRRRLSESGQRTVDGYGAERLARLLVTKDFHIRKVTIEDSIQLLEWRNDPEMRAVCFNQGCISFESHEKWLREKLGNNNTKFCLVEDKHGEPVGQYRLELDTDNGSAELSISFVPALRGRGLGPAFIELACRDAVRQNPNLEVFANIKSNNVMSQMAFRKAGFNAVATSTINDHVAIRFAFKKTMRDNGNRARVFATPLQKAS